MPRYYAGEESNWHHGRWHTHAFVRDREQGDVLVKQFHSVTAAIAYACAMNGQTQPVELEVKSC